MVWPLGAVFGVAPPVVATTRTTTLTFRGSGRGVAASAFFSASGSVGPRLPPFLPTSPRASGLLRREAPRGVRGPDRLLWFPRPAGAPCEGGTGLPPTRARLSARPSSPRGPRGLPRPGAAVTGRAGAEGRARRRPPLLGPAAL